MPGSVAGKESSPVEKKVEQVKKAEEDTKTTSDKPCCGETAVAGQCHSAQTPVEAMKSPREKYLYVLCLQSEENEQDKCGYLATIDADPSSSNYGKVIHRLYSSDPKDELHHFGWNSCVSCKNPAMQHRYLVVPGINSGNIHIVDVQNPAQPTLFKVISGAEVAEKFDATHPHTVHCLPSGEVMISYMGDKYGEGKGSFLLLDGKTFEPTGLWNRNDRPVMGYDFWYQPRHNIMVSSEFGVPNCFMKGFSPEDVKNNKLGNYLHFWNWADHTLIKSIHIGEEGAGSTTPLELRFLHNPEACEGFVGVALESTIRRFFKTPDGEWTTEVVIQVPPKQVENWTMPSMPANISDIIISLDDQFLYFADWLHGDVRQYNISDTKNPKFVSSVFLGGLISSDTGIKVVEDKELDKQPERLVVKGHPILAGPNMLQLSRDGKRLYVTMSILNSYDKQFYPEMVKNGSGIIMFNCSPDGMKVDEDFYVDLHNEPDGPARAHEVRYPGGDCTSDIWV
ncbi:methanethiol oxidase-like [Paramacrobiotus metropolitanus]|uniref:methanethiol oxidase-like n=1 Tax=Paramacrobiotus metropolitanus TaxID=2943436 RepID=UPI00244581CF|nr:methanethiol oxidase-like [Paramacrobiotus metropolitanus]XP_055346296.1 methanethiol oxidase-like [Paramacrobiotus metropolitanus]